MTERRRRCLASGPTSRRPTKQFMASSSDDRRRRRALRGAAAKGRLLWNGDRGALGGAGHHAEVTAASTVRRRSARARGSSGRSKIGAEYATPLDDDAHRPPTTPATARGAAGVRARVVWGLDEANRVATVAPVDVPPLDELVDIVEPWLVPLRSASSPSLGLPRSGGTTCRAWSEASIPAPDRRRRRPSPRPERGDDGRAAALVGWKPYQPQGTTISSSWASRSTVIA